MLKEDIFNIEIRKFLKKVGISCQREIEKSVRNAVDSSIIKKDQILTATVVLETPPAEPLSPGGPGGPLGPGGPITPIEKR